MKALLAALFAVLLPSMALAQGSLLQGGPATNGHVPMYVGAGANGSQTIVQDAGPAAGGGVGLGLSELNLTARGPGAGPYANSGTGPYGTHFCVQDNYSASAAYHYLCLDANAQGGGLITYGAAGAISQLPLDFIINGVTYTFPFTTGGVIGPGSSVVNDAACWNNTAGTLLKDCGVPLSGPGSSVNGDLVCWNGTAGTSLYDCGVPPGSQRSRITVPLTLYYRSDGTSTTCLVDSSAGACSPQGCSNAMQTYDINNLTITCQQGSQGFVNYTSGVTINAQVGGGVVYFKGSSTVGDTVFTTATGSPFLLNNVGETLVELDQMDLFTIGPAPLVNITYRSTLLPGDALRFGNTGGGAHIFIHDRLAQLLALNSHYSIIGAAANHITCNMGSFFYEANTITVTGALAFNTFVNFLNGCSIQVDLNFFAFSGVTGTTFSGSANGVINFLGTVTPTADASFTGTGSGIQMTVSLITGTITINDSISGTGVPALTVITGQISGTPGGNGVYLTNNPTTSSGATITSTTGGCGNPTVFPGNAKGLLQTGATCVN